MTKAEIKAIIASKIEGLGSAIDSASVLPTILNGIIDLFTQADWNEEDTESLGFILNKPSIPTAADMLAALTLTGDTDSITSASDLTAAECATALGLASADELEALMAGQYLRYAYGTDGTNILGVDSADGSSLSLGNGAVTVTVADDTWNVVVA